MYNINIVGTNTEYLYLQSSCLVYLLFVLEPIDSPNLLLRIPRSRCSNTVVLLLYVSHMLLHPLLIIQEYSGLPDFSN